MLLTIARDWLVCCSFIVDPQPPAWLLVMQRGGTWREYLNIFNNLVRIHYTLQYTFISFSVGNYFQKFPTLMNSGMNFVNWSYNTILGINRDHMFYSNHVLLFRKYLDFDNLPETNFSCQGKVIGGYYADVEAGCQMFHVCTIGQKGNSAIFLQSLL